jgi:hypothetical protein
MRKSYAMMTVLCIKNSGYIRSGVVASIPLQSPGHQDR